MKSPHRRTTVALAAIAALLFFLSPASAQMDARAIAKRLIPSVVDVLVYDQQGTQSKAGSGFILTANGLIATNFHVIDGGHSAKVVLHNQDVYPVTGVLEFEPEKDFAILKINAVDLRPAPLGNAEALEAAEPLLAIGAPLGLSHSVSTGIVSQIRSRGKEDARYRVVQHTAPISPGSSGGPLLNGRGEVIGMNTFSVEGGNSLFFAIPINYLRAALENSAGSVYPLDRLAVAIQEVRSRIAKEKLLAAIQENFIRYDDPEGLFSVLVPRSWQIQRSATETRQAGVYTRHVMFMAHAPGAEQAKIEGWLSEGVRFHLQLPATNQTWNVAGAAQWRQNQLKNMSSGYSRHETTDAAPAPFGNVPSLSAVVVGVSPSVSRPEAAFVFASLDEHCAMTAEITMPADKKDELRVIKQVIAASFKAAWLR